MQKRVIGYIFLIKVLLKLNMYAIIDDMKLAQ